MREAIDVFLGKIEGLHRATGMWLRTHPQEADAGTRYRVSLGLNDYREAIRTMAEPVYKAEELAGPVG
jgi:hypothetical protein